jgi:hypothetical protein
VKIVSVLRDFVVTVQSSYVVRMYSSSEYCMTRISNQVTAIIFSCQTRVSQCTERNFKNTFYFMENSTHCVKAEAVHMCLSYCLVCFKLQALTSLHFES